MNTRRLVLFHIPTLLLFLNLVHTKTANAGGFEYFDSNIDYWNEKPKSKAQEKQIQSVETKSSKKKFNWDKYLDPENDEFFREGDYTPPAPFMEVYRRPTKKNVLLWDKYIKKKNLIHKRALKNMKKYLSPNVVSPQIIAQEKRQVTNEKSITQIFKGKWIVFYFDKNCPHCEKMYPIINKLSMSGAVVQAVRLDTGNGIVSGLGVPWQRIKKGEQQRLKINVTPTTLIVEEETKKVKKLTGNRSLFEILKEAKNI